MSKTTQKNKELKAKEKSKAKENTDANGKNKQAQKTSSKKAPKTESAEKKAPNYGKCCTCMSHKNNPSYCKSKHRYCARKADACNSYKFKA